MRCSCGNCYFFAHQTIRADIVVDETGKFLKNLDSGLETAIYDASEPYGPFTCTACGKEYEELEGSV